jgi:DNA-binding NarL/FixJ family response regulator
MPSVLIIDDYVPNADSFAKLLSLEGFETATEYTGTGGLQAAFEGAFDVILVDLRLPDLSGIEVVGELRKRAVPARTVIFTMFPDLASSFEAARAGADGYVEGLLIRDELVTVVRQAVAGPLPVHSAQSAAFGWHHPRRSQS